MARKPTYEELEKRVKELEKETVKRRRAEEALQRAHDKLERRVEERTAELIVANKQLRAEIEERKQAEDTLRESEEKWRSLVENAPGFIITVNRDGKIQFINRGVPGISAKEAIGQSVYKYIEPEYRNTARETIKGVFKTDKPSSYEVKGIGPDGHHISWYETQVGPITHDSRVVAATLITTDISDRKRAEEALRESEEKYKTLTENSLTGVYIHQDGRYVFVNDRFAQIHGYKPEELLGEHYLTLIHPDERTRVKQIGSKRAKGEPAPRRYEVKRLRKDGEAVWCETIAVRIEYRGKPAIMGNIVDINEHKRAEESLRVSEERFRTFAEAAPYGLSIMRPDKTFEYLNPRFKEIFGYTTEDIPDKYIWFEKAYPDKEYRDTVISVWNQYFAEDFDGGQIEPNIFKVRCKDGQDKIIHFRNVISSDGRHFLTYQDITAQAKAEQALREREAELKIKTNSLEEMNTALRVLLERRDEDKTELEEKVLVNVKELVVPFLEKVKKTPLDPKQLSYIHILESNLNAIISPFMRNLSTKYVNLTPTEIRVAHLIREGKTTKDIGEVMALSPRTIETHRKNMRKKLGIEKNKGNLRSHLLSLH